MDALTGMMLFIKEKYGWKIFSRYFKLVDRYKVFPKVSSKVKVNSFIHLLSVAAGEDLSGLFIRWGFPVEEARLSCNVEISWEESQGRIKVFGVLEPPIVGIIYVEYRIGGSEKWTMLGITSTDDYGTYSYEWVPLEAGKYLIRARWVEGIDFELAASEVEELEVVKPVPTQKFRVGGLLLSFFRPLTASVLIALLIFLRKRIKTKKTRNTWMEKK